MRTKPRKTNEMQIICKMSILFLITSSILSILLNF